MPRRSPKPPSASHDAYRSDDLGNVAQALERLTFEVGRAGASETLGAPTLRRILLAVDGSAASKPALRWAGDLAKMYGAALTVTSVSPSPEVARALHAGTAGWSTVQVAFDECDELAEATLRRAEADLRQRGLDPTMELQHGQAAHAIVDLARSVDADLVVVGSHGHGLAERANLGSVGTGIKHHVPCSVLVARGPPTVRRVILATDGSPRASLAVGFGLDLTKRLQAKAVFVHSVDMSSYGLARTRQARLAKELAARADLEDLAERVPGSTFRVMAGPAARNLRKVAEKEGAGLIVVGSRGLGGLKGLALGSVSDALTHKAPTSVLAVKPKAE